MFVTKFDSFEADKLSFGKIEERRYGTKHLAIKYEDGPFLLQTPYMSNNIKLFPKKSEKDTGDSLVMYMNINYSDEQAFMNTVNEINSHVQQYVKDHTKTLFETKKRPGNVDTMFYDPVTQTGDFNPSFRANIAINGSNVPVATEFYDGMGDKLKYEDFMDIMTVDGKFEGRAIIEFTHIYVLPDRRYGYKSNVRVIQRCDKPEADKVAGISGHESGGSSKTKEIGCAFL